MTALEQNEHKGNLSPLASHIENWFKRQSWARFLYNHNPFYVISAALVFAGLRSSFDTGRETFKAWPLTCSLAAFTVLLVTTAVLIIRWGKVWEDARSILLLVVLMFLGISVTFDSILANDPDVAKWYYLGGLAFAVAVTETALRSLPLRLPALYRVPFHLIVALFYLYPLLMTGLLQTPNSAVLQWELFGFSTVAAAIFLTLLPALHRGQSYANDNHSPWRWPLFPWTLFGMLWLCICLRAYYLCQSLHFVDYANSIFGGYFLAPMMLAAAVLFVEGGKVTGSSWATRLGLMLPVVMIVMAATGHRQDLVYRDFLDRFQTSLHATPLFIVLWMAIGFYALTVLRRVRRGTEMLMLAVGTLTVVGPQTLDFHVLRLVQTWPLVLLGVVQLLVGPWHWKSRQTVVGACLMLVSAILEWRGTWFTSYLGIFPCHILLAIFLIVGMLFDDHLARRLRRWSAAFIAGFALLVIGERTELVHDFPYWWVVLYPLAMALIAVYCGWQTRVRQFYVSSAIASIMWVGVYGASGYAEARRHLVGLDQIALGLFFFGCAALISLAKAGVLRRWITSLIMLLRRQPASSG